MAFETGGGGALFFFSPSNLQKLEQTGGPNEKRRGHFQINNTNPFNGPDWLQ